MNSSATSLSFGSKIKFVCNNWMPLKGKKVEENKICTSKNAYTKGIANCTGGGVVNGEGVTMFHLQPETDIPDYENEIVEESGLNARNRENYNGLITGGFSYYMRHHPFLCSKAKEVDSKTMFDNIKRAFDENDLSYSVVWGQQNPTSTDIQYSRENDTWYISSYEFTHGHFDNIKKKGVLKTIEDVKEAFAVIKFSEKDKKDGIFINGRRLSDDEVAYLEQDLETEYKDREYNNEKDVKPT